MLVSIPQFMAAAGNCAGYFMCYGTIHISSSLAWRLPFIVAAILAVALAISCQCLPVSPRWLLQHGRRGEANREVKRLKLPQEEEQQLMSTSTIHERAGHGLSAVFHRQYRARTSLGLFILGMIQLCGFALLYVSTWGLVGKVYAGEIQPEETRAASRPEFCKQPR